MKNMMPPGFQKGRRAGAGGPMAPGNAPKGRSGARKGMPNFKSRLSKPGGMAKGGPVGGQGSGVGRLKHKK